MFSGLWRNPDFVKLWLGQAASQVGGVIRMLALPLTAIITLDASPFEVGLLMAVSGLPALVIGPVAGAYVDRHRRRSILIASDWLRALVIAAVPVAYFADSLQMWMLYLAAVAMGTLSLLFEVSYRSYLPSLVDRSELVEGNSKLEISRSAAEIAGPGIGGAIVQIAGAPVALLADAASFAVSAITLHTIKKEEAEPARAEGSDGLFKEARNGLGYVWNHSLLRPLVLAAAVLGFFNAMIEAVFLLYMTDRLDLSPGLIGGIFVVGGVGLALGAMTANRIAAMAGIGVTISAAMAVFAVSDLALPLAGGPLPAVVAVLVIGMFGFSFALPLYRVTQVSLSQAVTEAKLHGRMNAVFQLALVGTVPVGALLGGLSGELIGLRETLFLGVGGEAVAALLLLISPIRLVKTLPD